MQSTHLNVAWAAGLFRAYSRLDQAVDVEDAEEAVADIRKIGRESVPAAILSSLLLIHFERPILLPLAALACGTSIVLLVKRLVS